MLLISGIEHIDAIVDDLDQAMRKAMEKVGHSGVAGGIREGGGQGKQREGGKCSGWSGAGDGGAVWVENQFLNTFAVGEAVARKTCRTKTAGQASSDESARCSG